MSSYSGCRVLVTYEDGRAAFEDDDCDVSIEAGELLVTYWDERGPVVLAGISQGDAFDVVARSRPRRARLARSGDVLEGRWHEGDEAGRLRIELVPC